MQSFFFVSLRETFYKYDLKILYCVITYLTRIADLNVISILLLAYWDEVKDIMFAGVWPCTEVEEHDVVILVQRLHLHLHLFGLSIDVHGKLKRQINLNILVQSR